MVDFVNGYKSTQFRASEALARLQKDVVPIDLRYIEFESAINHRFVFLPAAMFGFATLVGAMMCFPTCCSCRYRKSRRVRGKAYIAFVFVIIIAILTSAASISRENELDREMSAMASSFDDLCKIFTECRTQLGKRVKLLEQAEGGIDMLLKFILDAEFPRELETLLRISKDSFREFEKRTDKLSQAMNFVGGELDFDLVDDETSEPGYEEDVLPLSATLSIVSTVILLGITFFFYNPGKRKFKTVKTVVRKSLGLAVIALAIGLSYFSVLRASFLASAGHFSMNFCLEDVDQALLNGIATVLDQQPLKVGECGQPNLDQNADSLLAQQTICFYQGCSGHFVLEEAIQHLDGTRVKLLNTLRNSSWQPSMNASGYHEEVALLLGFLEDPFFNWIGELEQAFQCEQTNRVYQNIVHHGMCNTLATTVLKAWKGFYISTIFLLFALFLTLHFNLATDADHIFEGTKDAYKGGHQTHYNHSDAELDPVYLSASAWPVKAPRETSVGSTEPQLAPEAAVIYPNGSQPFHRSSKAVTML